MPGTLKKLERQEKSYNLFQQEKQSIKYAFNPEKETLTCWTK